MTPPSANRRWPALLAALGLLFAVFSVWSALRAMNGVSAVSDRDYYRQGLRYDDSLIEQRAAATAGWSLETTLSGGRLEVRLHDRDGRPVAGGRGDVELADGSRYPLREAAHGLYLAPLELSWQPAAFVLLRFEREGASFIRRLLLK